METRPEIRTCSNCGSSVSITYCPGCGQKWLDPKHLTIRSILGEFVQKIFDLDSRWMKTLVPLLLRPGFLTKEYLAGRHQRYVKPISLFISANLLFFLVGHRIGLMRWNMLHAYGEKGREMILERANHLDVDATVFADRLNTALGELQRSFFFGVILLFSVLVFLVSRDRGRRPLGSLVYSIHFHASFLLMFPLTALAVVLMLGAVDLAAGTSWAPYIGRDPGIGYLALAVMWTYHLIGLRSAFGDGWVASGLKSAFLAVGGGLLMVPFGQMVLFWIVWAFAA